MKALVYHGPGQKSWDDVPDAAIQDPTDVVVRVDTTTICGTDLHILAGDVPAVTEGRILGHEAVGRITAVGDAVSSFEVGDRVLVPAITRCGRCEYCQRNMPSHCQTVGGIGWIFGHLIDGTQAEAVRVPYADTSLYHLPEDVSDEKAIFLADSLPTGYEVGVLAGGVRPGDTIAVVGAGAVGLVRHPDHGTLGRGAGDRRRHQQVPAREGDGLRGDGHRRGRTQHRRRRPRAHRRARRRRGDRGGGLPGDAADAAAMVRPGGTVANIGVHGTPVELPMQELWIQNISITMGLVDTVSIPTLLKMVASGKIPSEKMGTHTFTFDQLDEAYDVFKNAADNLALKVVIQPA